MIVQVGIILIVGQVNKAGDGLRVENIAGGGGEGVAILLLGKDAADRAAAMDMPDRARSYEARASAIFPRRRHKSACAEWMK